MLSESSVWISTFDSGLSHIFNRWTPLNRRGGRSPMSCFLWMVLGCVCRKKICLCASASPPQPWAASRFTVCLLMWRNKDRVQCTSWDNSPTHTRRKWQGKHKTNVCKKQTDNDTNTVRHSDKWHTCKNNYMHTHRNTHTHTNKSMWTISFNPHRHANHEIHSKSSIHKHTDRYKPKLLYSSMPSHTHSTHTPGTTTTTTCRAADKNWLPFATAASVCDFGLCFSSSQLLSPQWSHRHRDWDIWEQNMKADAWRESDCCSNEWLFCKNWFGYFWRDG